MASDPTLYLDGVGGWIPEPFGAGKLLEMDAGVVVEGHVVEGRNGAFDGRVNDSLPGTVLAR